MSNDNLKLCRLFINGSPLRVVDITNKKHREYIKWLKDTLGKYIREMYLIPVVIPGIE